MEITFSRHAQRRMQLFEIEENDVTGTVNRYRGKRVLGLGRHEVVNMDMSKKYGYPLKVVFFQENDKIVVITAYPLKRERMR